MRDDTVGGVSARHLLRSLGRAALDRLLIVSGREPPDARYARRHARAVRKVCDCALRGRADWLRAMGPWRDVPGPDERVVELPWAYQRLGGGGRLLDVGSTLNAPYHIERLRPRFEAITFLNAYRDDGYRSRVPGVSYVTRDARDPGLPPALFARVTCLSVLEHVGCDNTVYGAPPQPPASAGETRAARAAVMRALRPLVAQGGSLLVTVPFGRYEDRGWFVQLDAAELDDLVAAFGPARLDAAYYLHDTAWRPARAEECAGLRYGERTRGASAAACLELRA